MAALGANRHSAFRLASSSAWASHCAAMWRRVAVISGARSIRRRISTATIRRNAMVLWSLRLISVIVGPSLFNPETLTYKPPPSQFATGIFPAGEPIAPAQPNGRFPKVTHYRRPQPADRHNRGGQDAGLRRQSAPALPIRARQAAMIGRLLDSLGFVLEIVGPLAELVPDLLPNRNSHQIAAPLSFRTKILCVHCSPLPSPP